MPCCSPCNSRARFSPSRSGGAHLKLQSSAAPGSNSWIPRSKKQSDLAEQPASAGQPCRLAHSLPALKQQSMRLWQAQGHCYTPQQTAAGGAGPAAAFRAGGGWVGVGWASASAAPGVPRGYVLCGKVEVVRAGLHAQRQALRLGGPQLRQQVGICRGGQAQAARSSVGTGEPRLGKEVLRSRPRLQGARECSRQASQHAAAFTFKHTWSLAGRHALISQAVGCDARQASRARQLRWQLHLQGARCAA